MMGRKHREQASLFYEFRLDDMIPKGHLLRRINVFVTSVLGDLHDATTATAKRSESAVKAASGFPVSRSQSLSVLSAEADSARRTSGSAATAVPRPPLAQKASYFEGVVTLLKIGCGFVGIRCYNHAAATTSRHVCRA